MQHHLVVQDCFNSILRLRAAKDDVPCACDVHGLLCVALERMLSSPAALGLAAQDVQDIAFAIAALADEVAMRAGEAVAAMWQSQALQTLYFNDFGAGDLFFERLAAIREGPMRPQVLLAYYTALALGFEGRLGDKAGRTELGRLIAELRGALEGPPQGSPYSLSPHALAKRTEDTPATRLRAPDAVVLLMCAAAVVLFVALQALLRNRLQQVVELTQWRHAQIAQDAPSEQVGVGP